MRYGENLKNSTAPAREHQHRGFGGSEIASKSVKTRIENGSKNGAEHHDKIHYYRQRDPN